MNLIHCLIVMIFSVICQTSLYALSIDEQTVIQSILEKIPDDDKYCLEAFFRHLIADESLGYVLLGDKPMILCALYSKPLNIIKSKSNPLIHNYLWNSYLVWKKYQSIFPIKNYIFRVYKSNISKYQYDILIINKEKFLKIIQENIDLFYDKINSSINPLKILEQMEISDDILVNLLKDHEDLLGILLGFGRHNSELFQKRYKLDLQGKYNPPYDLKTINEFYKLTRFPLDDSIFDFIKLPCYVEDKDNSESIQVRQKYIDAQKRLGEIYSQGRFLEITLQALTQTH